MTKGTKIALLLIILSVLFLIRPRDIFPSEVTLDSQYAILIMDLSLYHEVPPHIAVAIAVVESNIEMITSIPNTNGSYDIGIFQLNSNYIEYFEKRLWDNPWEFNPYNMYDNIEMGIMILKDLSIRTGSWDTAVKAYHVGMTGLSINPDLADNYFNKVIRALL